MEVTNLDPAICGGATGTEGVARTVVAVKPGGNLAVTLYPPFSLRPDAAKWVVDSAPSNILVAENEGAEEGQEFRVQMPNGEFETLDIWFGFVTDADGQVVSNGRFHLQLTMGLRQ